MSSPASPPGVGIDIIPVGRLARALRRRPQLKARLFTPAEQRFCETKARPAQHYAARFAAKEAVAKALGRSLSWQEVEIVRDPAGAPRARLYGRARSLAGGRPVAVSLSHAGDYAVACAVFHTMAAPPGPISGKIQDQP